MKPTVLAHSFEIYVPSHCRCGKPLPESLREEILGEVKVTMAGWFGGGSARKADPRIERIQGIWDSGCGKPDEEFIDVVQSHTDEETRDDTFTEFTAYVAQLANRLTQEAMACRVGGKMFIYPATSDPKPHRCAGGVTTATTPKPKESGDLERKMALQAALQRMGSANDVRDIFCNLLHYKYEDATLPTAKWPDAVKQCLAPGAAPQVIADQNGFKIIYLQLADGSLRKSSERQLVQRLVKEDPGMRGLIVVSDINQKQWNLVNVKFDRDGKNRDHILLRRMRVGPGQPVRTAVERLSQVDVEILGEEAGAADLQDKHDAAFDVAAVTKQFFSDVANWYFWALKHATFPKDAPKEADGHDHVALIRLITRLIFCWFLREKGLIPDTLFDRRKLTEILNGFAPDKPKDKNSVFYHAILQNLFFATLSTEHKDRGWAREGQNMMAHSLYRFKECFQNPKTALDLFKSIPFLNGGLLECLDRDLGEDPKPRYIRIDGFSRRPDSQACVPDFLFFGKEREIDLSDDYGDRRFRNVRVRGLIDTLLHYNFTIEENTPIEEEVALDPELCGMVFENLLAAYNPETGTTARKQSGSFYTPREIVNYMVDEALIATLSTKLEQNKNVGQTFLSASSKEPQTGMSVPPPITKSRRDLPHWKKDGAIYWITFRMADSLPQEKLRAWTEERTAWAKHHPEPWDKPTWKEYNQRFGDKLEAWLDAGMGSRALAREEVREAVKSCLTRFDGERLRLHAAVIMPNHVHALIEPVDGHDLSKIMQGIKGASAREANKILGTTGSTFWLDESYDHIVRSEEQYQHFLRYIADNPVKASLRKSEYWLREGSTDILVCASSKEGQTGMSATRMRHLFAYNDEPHQFTPKEVTALIAAIDTLKTLDPAVGSGAFPMGLLHKLVFILGKLDPRNEQWKERQIARVREAIAVAEKIEDDTIRSRTVEELEQQVLNVEESFDRNELDYGRKLYLIENCIYGVDIQPIAVQIAKMRFFISLIVDQNIDDNLPNRGVRPLPNLETKFVAANSLIGIERPGQQFLRNFEIDTKEAELRRVRERHFLARTPKSKEKCRKEDARLRAEIAELLKDDGWDDKIAEDLARWDPYDQHRSETFFDPEWMFGNTRGFDVTIGNPPYVRADEQSEANIAQRKAILAGKQYETLWEKWDLFVPFLERSYKLLRPNGVSSMIVSDAFCHSKYAQKAQNWFLQNARILRLDFCGEVKIFDAAVHNVITCFQKADGANSKPLRRLHRESFGEITELPSDEQTSLTSRAFFPEGESKSKFSALTLPIGGICYISYGCRPNSDEKKAKGLFVAADLVSSTKDAQHPKPYIEAKEADKWLLCSRHWLEWGTARSPCLLARPAFEKLFEVPEKVVAARVAGGENLAYYDDSQTFHNHTLISFVNWEALSGVRNNSLKKAARYLGEKPLRPDLPKREELEATSRRFAVKYLLGVMNSASAREFLRANRRSNTDLYPDDWKKLPIPDVAASKQQPIIALVDKILNIKRKNPAADIGELEAQIDAKVKALYGN